MNPVELIINSIFILLLIVLLVVIVRYPRAFFIQIPLAIIKLPFVAIKEELPLDFFLDVFGIITGRDINNKYKTKRRRFLTFSRCSKILLTTGSDESIVKLKLAEAIESLNNAIKIDHFKLSVTPEQTLSIPPPDITFHDFHFLIKFLTDGPVKTVGIVESKRLVYIVYDDPKTDNLIGQTDHGQKFFISLIDNFNKKQFLRMNDEIEIIEKYDMTRIQNDLRAKHLSKSKRQPD